MKLNCKMRYFECPVCKNTMTAFKKSSKQTSKDHVKHMWCYICKDVVGFVQKDKYGR